ncbi:hypothetical protein ACOME3_008445 [Neoechinorhynchus agilis]
MQDNIIEETITVQLYGANLMLIIQTDRKLYKQGDIVSLRCLVLYSDELIGYQGPIVLAVTDPGGNVIRLWDDEETKAGVFSADFQIPLMTSINGNYSIECRAHDVVATETVEVINFYRKIIGLYIYCPSYLFIRSSHEQTISNVVLPIIVQTMYANNHPAETILEITGYCSVYQKASTKAAIIFNYTVNGIIGEYSIEIPIGAILEMYEENNECQFLHVSVTAVDPWYFESIKVSRTVELRKRTIDIELVTQCKYFPNYANLIWFRILGMQDSLNTFNLAYEWSTELQVLSLQNITSNSSSGVSQTLGDGTFSFFEFIGPFEVDYFDLVAILMLDDWTMRKTFVCKKQPLDHRFISLRITSDLMAQYPVSCPFMCLSSTTCVQIDYPISIELSSKEPLLKAYYTVCSY